MASNFSFEATTTGETMNATVTDCDNAADINQGLLSFPDREGEPVLRCAKNGAIEFKAGVTESMIEMMGILLTRAAHSSAEQRTAHVSAVGRAR